MFEIFELFEALGPSLKRSRHRGAPLVGGRHFVSYVRVEAWHAALFD